MATKSLNTLGNRLSTVLRTRGVSNAQLAKDCHVTRQSVIHWRKPGFKRLDAAMALIICDKYKVNLRWLVLGEGDMNSSGNLEVDTERLTTAIMMLETHLQDAGLRLTPEKRARATGIIYQLLSGVLADSAEPVVIKNVLRLVA